MHGRTLAAVGAALFALAAIAAGCSSSSSSGTPATAKPSASASASSSPGTSASPSSSPVGSATPTSATTTAPLTSSVTFPTVGGYGAKLSFASAPSPNDVSTSITGYNYGPAGIPTNAPNAQPSPASGETATVVATWEFTPAGSGTISVPAPEQVFSGLSAAPSGKAYYSYFADITAGASNGYNGGTGSGFQESGGTVTIPSSGGGTTLTEGHTYALQIVYF